MASPHDHVDSVAATDSTSGDLAGSAPDDTADSDDQLTYPFKRWLSADPGRPVVAAGLALVLVQLVLRSWSKFGGSFTADDLSFMSRAFTMPFWSSDYLLAGWNGHFMPGAFVQVKVLATLWPYNYVPVAVVDVALQGIVSLLVLRLLLNLFGPRYEILIPLAFCVLTPMTLPAFLWWAAALNQLWGQLAAVLMLLAQLRYHRTGRLRDGLLGVLALVLGLLFSEKILLMVPVVAAFTFLWFTPGPPLQRLRLALTQNGRLWSAYAAVVLVYALAYKLLIVAPLSTGDPFTVTVETVGRGLVVAVIPAVFGGPFVWAGIHLGGYAATPLPVVVILLITSALLVWYSIWRNARAAFGWWVILGYHLMNAGILGATRATYIGSVIGVEYRYHSDTALIIGVFGTMAFLPLQGRFAKGTYQPLRLRPGRGSAGSLNPGIAGGITVALSLAAVVSTLTYDPLWRHNTRGVYLDNVRSSLGEVDHPVTVKDFPVEFIGDSDSSKLFSAMEPTPTFLTRGASADTVFVPDEQGVLRVGLVDGFPNTPGPVAGCGWPLGQIPTSVPLTRPTLDWLWTAQMSYVATNDTDVTVTAGQTTSTLHLKAGANTVFFVAEGVVPRIDFGAVSIGTVCTDSIVVGDLKPMPNTTVAGYYGAQN